MSDKMKTTHVLKTLLLGTAAMCSAENYYVSKQGHDEAAGTKEAPFATIQRAASVMRPGDECLIASGTYDETITVKQSGTADDPIVFRPASEADHVVLTGADPISETRWERIGENRFKCKITLPLDSGNQVFLNENALVEARWPNMGDNLLKPTLSIMDEGTTPERILDADLPDYDFTGGRVWVHAPLYWQNWDTEIPGHEGQSLQIKNRAPFAGKNQHVAGKGAGFFVYGIRDALDADNEWYYDADRQELFIFRSDGKLPRQPYRVKKRPHILDVSGRQHLEFHGLTITGSGILTDQKTEQENKMNRRDFIAAGSLAGGSVLAGARGIRQKPVPSFLEDVAAHYQINPCQAHLEWFQNAKFGLFIHYGLYSLLKGEWNGVTSRPAEWVQLQSLVPVTTYARLKDEFKADRFDGVSHLLMNPDKVHQFRLQELYDHIHSLQPQVLVSYKQRVLGTEDFKAPERHFTGISDVPLEICDTLQEKSWGYAKYDEGKHKTADQVMETLARAEAIPANLLLNTGPLPDGSIVPDDVKTLKEVGRRLRSA